MPRGGGRGRGGARAVFTRAFLGKKRTSIYISREKGDHYYIQTRHNDLFFAITMFFLGKRKKIGPKARVNTERVYRIVLVPPRHPIILLKSNEFNMAAVSVKRSIRIRADLNNLDRLN